MTVQLGDLRLYTEVGRGIDFYLIIHDDGQRESSYKVLRFESYLTGETVGKTYAKSDPLVSGPEEWLP